MLIAIITGIFGQDGAYLAKYLLEKNYQVIGVTRNYSDPKSSKLDYLKITDKILIEECDLTNLNDVKVLLEKYHPSEFYNLSAQSSVGVSFDNPIATIQYNINSVLNILESIKALSSTVRFFQASSSEIFGTINKLPVSLQTPINPVNPYGISKATAFFLTSTYRQNYQLYTVNGVFFNHESYLRNEHFFVKKVIKESIKISRGDALVLKVGNIDIKRDFGFAPFYVEAMWLSLQQTLSDDYIICSGHSLSLREIIYYVFDKLNIDKSKVVEDQTLLRPSDVQDIYGDNSLTRQKLNWHYNYSFFEVLDWLIDEEILNY
jgi:GDPmannose 4,6-dehydratase